MPFSESVPTEPARRTQLSLRERKFARTKLALLRALLDRLREKPMAEVTVKDLCDDAEVSEATFFNYFPRKEDVLHYFIRLWMLEVTWRANGAVGADGGLEYIEFMFRDTAARITDTPRVMQEIIAKLALNKHPPGCVANECLVTLAEKLQAFPDLAGVEDLPEMDLPDMFARPVARAVERGELAASTDVEDVVVSLVSIFFGVPLWFCHEAPEQVAVHYSRQLRALWAAHRG